MKPAVFSLAPIEREQSLLLRFWKEFAESKLALIGAAVLTLIILIAIFAPVISPQNPYDLTKLDILDSRLAPGEVSSTGAKSFRGGVSSWRQVCNLPDLRTS